MPQRLRWAFAIEGWLLMILLAATLIHEARFWLTLLRWGVTIQGQLGF